jgi:tetratricopeptide (TPR) repeat protein
MTRLIAAPAARTVGVSALGVSALAVLAAVALAAGPARAAVTVVGAGLAEACSKAAIAGGSALSSQALCTQALNEEILTRRDRAGTFVNRGILKMRRGEMAPALADFDEAARYQPNLGDIYVNRGAALIAQHRYADGLADLNKSLALGVGEPAKAYYNRAIAYEALDDVKSAYFDYQKALELSPDWTAPRKELARFHVARSE